MTTTARSVPMRHSTASAPRRLSPTVAFYLQASIVVTFLAGSSAPTPLYAVYQDEWGFTPITTTVVFGVYAVAVLVALLIAGSLSDHVGRRPVLIAAIAGQGDPGAGHRIGGRRARRRDAGPEQGQGHPGQRGRPDDRNGGRRHRVRPAGA